MMDDDGINVGPGDWIAFSYGIPPVGVRARISSRDGRLIATVLGRHRPKQIALSDLRRHVGNWYRTNGPGYQT